MKKVAIFLIENIATLLFVIGFVMLVIAAYSLSVVLGHAALGISLIILGIAYDRANGEQEGR